MNQNQKSMGKFKIFLMMLLLIVTSCSLTSCSDDKDEPSAPSIIGTWADIEKTELEYVSSTLGVSWTFTTSGNATQRIWLIVNGVTQRDNKTKFTYTYDGKNITTTSASGKKVVHSVSVIGNTMRLGDGEGGYFNLTKQ